LTAILAAVDNSDFAYAVIQRAVQLALTRKSDLVILSVIKPGFTGRDTMRGEDEKLTIFHRQLIYKCFPPDGIAVESTSSDAVYRATSNGNLKIESKIEHGDPADRICDVAEKMKAELVLVGNRGLGEAGTLVLGSVSDNVVRKCSRSVMVVKGEVFWPFRPEI